jgi:beta-ureidopropionase
MGSVEVLCMQESITRPYFCAEQNPGWYDAVERIPNSPTVKLMQEFARRYADQPRPEQRSICASNT